MERPLIEIESAKTGEPVIKRNGRLLASIFNPIHEADAWAEKALGVITDDETPIVIGLGSGYHVSALKAHLGARPILVIENSLEIEKAALGFNAKLSSEEILVEPDWLKLPDHPRFRDAVGGLFRGLVHGPSVQIEPDYFSAVERLLRARDKLSFLVFLKTRPELLSLLDASQVNLIDNAEAVSIRTMTRLFAPHAAATRERRIWKVLEELIL